MHRCERSSFQKLPTAALFLTKNVAPQLAPARIGRRDLFGVFLERRVPDVGFNGRSRGRSRVRRLRRGFRSGSSYGLPVCCSHGLFEGQNPVGGLSLMSLATLTGACL